MIGSVGGEAVGLLWVPPIGARGWRRVRGGGAFGEHGHQTIEGVGAGLLFGGKQPVQWIRHE